MGVHVREKRGLLYLDVYLDGKRHWESLGLRVKGVDATGVKEALKLAHRIRDERERQIATAKAGLIDPLAGKLPFIALTEKLGANKPAKDPVNKSMKYLKEYAGNIAVQAVNEQWLEGYQQFLKETSLGQSTAARYYSVAVLVLKRAVRDRVIVRNPGEAVRPMKVMETEKVHLEPAELELLANTPLGGNLGGEVRRAFLFAALTGLRVSDLKTLVWGDIDRAKQAIRKRQYKTRHFVSIPIHPDAWEQINTLDIAGRDTPVFPLLADTNTNTNDYLKRWAVSAGLDKVIGWHTARHTFAVLSIGRRG